MKERGLIQHRPTRRMTRDAAVLSTYPLDGMIAEVHRLLGPTWVLPPYDRLLPPNLESPSSTLQQDDIDFLIRKGAFDVLEPQSALEFFKAYIRHVHPHVPFLDLDRFSAFLLEWQTGCENAGYKGQKTSLLLFQAVMFSGAFFVDLKHIYAAGFLSRRSALDSLFQRARVLYDLDAEDNKLTAVQALLLMTYWYENPEWHKDGRHWIGVCISLAYNVELHLDYSGHPDWGLRKVLWWCIFTRDRLMSLGLQQPPIIKDQLQSSIPLLATDKDDIVAPRFVSKIGISYYANRHERLAQIFIHKAHLCRCVRDDLFSWNCQPINTRQPITPSRKSCLWLSKLELDNWLQELPENISFHPTPFITDESDLLLHSHSAWLKLIYLELHGVIHRQLDFLSEKYSSRQQLSIEAPDCPVLQSAVEFTMILQDLHEKHLISYLTTTSVPMILRAGILHIQEIFLANSISNSASIRRLLHCILSLQQLGSRYGSALFVASLLGAPKGLSVVTSTPSEILAHVDIESLGRLTSNFSDCSDKTVIKIREPYDVDIVSGLKSKVENLKIAAL
ncbi:hypothetical protein N7478_008419 [Penicillium angulare]|uniref:uncharacterized protein n=1 Tax=Penicillium angulare TaxID=116970 RepID=UPI0025415E94|nr:uncharacterized protein N7478_008419 [Penicillium angulare]KAJ5273294.1 hypothetical protein N7478_008419 [Penicillium angulare]